MFQFIDLLIASAQALPGTVDNPCSNGALRHVEGSSTGSCTWTYKNDHLSVQEACHTGAQHFIWRLPDSVKGNTPCTLDVVEFVAEFQNFHCDRMYAGNQHEAKACRDGIQKAVNKIKKRLVAL